jgi:hypothetical protein
MRSGGGGVIVERMRETFIGGASGKRGRRSKAAWQEIVQHWRGSGQTAEVYAQRHGLHAGTLAVWGSRLRREVSAAREPVSGGGGVTFLPVQVVSGQARKDDPRESGELEIILRNGRRVVVRGDVGGDTLRRILELAEGGGVC